MKRTQFLLAFLILATIATGSLLAQSNSFIGTWKLNLEKSKYEPGPAPKSLTRTVEAQGDGAKYSFEGVSADGKTVAYSYTTNYDGKDYPVTGSGMPGGANAIAIKRVGANKVEATLKKNGTVVGTSIAEVSTDGKVTTIKGKGKNPDGKEYHVEAVYDKQ